MAKISYNNWAPLTACPNISMKHLEKSTIVFNDFDEQKPARLRQTIVLMKFAISRT